MATSIRSKSLQKTPATKKTSDLPPVRSLAQQAQFTASLMNVEEAVLQALDIESQRQVHLPDDVCWNRRLKSIATRVSLALAELRGPRRMHHHYSEQAHSMITTPLCGDSPLEVLLRVCQEAAEKCADFVGVSHPQINRDAHRLEHELRLFLHPLQAKK